MKNKIYIIGIGGIGISAIARYYLNQGYKVYGNDKNKSELTNKLEKEGVILCDLEELIEKKIEVDFIVYTEAISKDHNNLEISRKNKIKTLSYPEALAEIVNNKKLISVAGSHGKSTTTSLISLVLKNSEIGVNAIIGTILKEFEGKNAYFSDSDIFVIEACEYKRSFLNYKPTVGIITNIELDHLDYYKNLDDYIDAFREYLNNVLPGGYAILNGNDENCKKLLGIRKDINYIEVYDIFFTFNGNKYELPELKMQVPGKHIEYDAHIAYVIGYMFGLVHEKIILTLLNFTGTWRRSEIIKETKNGNILISDYGHHPTEIELNTKALKEKYSDKKLFVVFQPHQYNRTIELLEGFKECFTYCDKVIIPNIYESRDSIEDKKNMDSKKLVKLINHDNVIDGEGLENTLILIKEYDIENPKSSIILLLGAGDIDDLRSFIQ